MRKATFAGGGASVGEQNAIKRGILNIRRSYGSSQVFGDTSCFVLKPFPTNPWVLDSCLLEEAGLRYFFGHSSSNIFDVKIYEPTFYDNFDKPSFSWVNGCYGSDFTGADSSMAERWLKAPNQGAVAWMGNTTAAYLSPLKIYGEIFMPLFANKMVEQPIGDIMFATVKKYTDSVPGIQTRNHTRQMVLLGDPSLILSRKQGYPLSIPYPKHPSVLIYPNPAKTFIYIESDFGSIANASLLATDGRQVAVAKPDGERLRVNVRGLAPGVYLLRFREGEVWRSRKVMVE
jgi:hypothetical protein